MANDDPEVPLQAEVSAPHEQPPREVASLIRATYSHSGPLPPAAELANYDRVVPGLADRLVTSFEKQLDHRIAMEKAVITGGIRNERNGLIAGVTIVLSTLLATCFLATHGLSGWGIVAVLAEIAGLVYAVRHVADKNAEERKEKARIEMQMERDMADHEEKTEGKAVRGV